MDPKPHLYELLKEFKTAMLVTRTANDGLHARPMAIAELKPDSDTYFATRIDTPKVDEITSNPEVLLTFQAGSRLATMRGTVSVLRDRALIDRLWSEAWRMWFPKGKDDPSLCILKFTGQSAEFWDDSGVEGLSYLFEGVKAVFKGRTPNVGENQNAKVRL